MAYSEAGGNANLSFPGTAGNNLSVNSTAAISTTGTASHGIATHSVGGDGSDAISFGGVTTGAGSLGGAGGAVSVTSNGTIGTSGPGAHGISATSRGGDGGANKFPYGVASGGAGGRAGDVTVSNSGSITTTGSASHGIFAQSTAGGTSSLFNAAVGGAAGNITVTSNGNITTNGTNSFGIYAQGDSPSSNVTINVNGDITINGTGGGAVFASGNNVIVNIGANARVVSNGLHIDAAGSTASINNSGLLRGAIYLGGDSTAGVLNNNAGGILENGRLSLFNGTLNNAGTVSPGGTGTVTSTLLSGNFAQTSTGVLKVDADWTGSGGAGSADQILVGRAAILAGTVIVNPINFPTTGGLTKTFTVLTAHDGITNNGISIANTAAVNYALLFPDARTMNVQATINFQGVGLNSLTSNQSGVGGNLNTILGGGTNLGFMPALMQLPAGGGLGGALNQLAPIGAMAARSPPR